MHRQTKQQWISSSHQHTWKKNNFLKFAISFHLSYLFTNISYQTRYHLTSVQNDAVLQKKLTAELKLSFVKTQGDEELEHSQ